jgi:DNA polymerase elongation subunit (family B)
MMNNPQDYVVYVDTDSLYLKIGQYLTDRGVKDRFDKLDVKEQVKYVEKLSKVISSYVNDRSLTITQQSHYNSRVEDFKIVFEPEKIALTGLFASKKRYATWTLTNDGAWKDSLSITGLEVIRSDSPEIVKPKILKILEMVLRKHSSEDIRTAINQYKAELKQATPEEIAENKGINQLSKYLLPDYQWRLKTPHQLKGVANYMFLLNKFKLDGKYDAPQEGVKAKIVYLKPNKFGKDCLTFYQWPSEFDKLGIHVDYDKMIETNFIKKVRGLLSVINKEELLEIKGLF